MISLLLGLALLGSAAAREPATLPQHPLEEAIEAANRSFLTQWGPTKFNAAQGAPDGYADCGPTSWLMAASGIGLVPHPEPRDAQARIEQIRARAHPAALHSMATTGKEIAPAFQALGAQVKQLEPTLTAADAALASGAVLLLRGSPIGLWETRLKGSGQYLTQTPVKQHWVRVTGLVGDSYVVSDPLSRIGVIAVPRRRLRQFLEQGASRGAEEAWSMRAPLKPNP